MAKLVNISLLIIFLSCGALSAQRRIINRGVDEYSKGQYRQSELSWKAALQKKNTFEGRYNLGDSYYKQGKYGQAAESFKKASEISGGQAKAKALYNMGNALLKEGRSDEAIAAYKNALRLTPSDKQIKYNLSYLLRKNNNQKNQNNGKNKNKNDKNKDNKNKDNKNNNDKNKNNNNNQNQNRMSKQEAERILDALRQKESDLRRQEQKGKNMSRASKDKDW